jgi:hypothetical protein
MRVRMKDCYLANRIFLQSGDIRRRLCGDTVGFVAIDSQEQSFVIMIAHVNELIDNWNDEIMDMTAGLSYAPLF